MLRRDSTEFLVSESTVYKSNELYPWDCPTIDEQLELLEKITKKTRPLPQENYVPVKRSYGNVHYDASTRDIYIDKGNGEYVRLNEREIESRGLRRRF